MKSRKYKYTLRPLTHTSMVLFLFRSLKLSTTTPEHWIVLIFSISQVLSLACQFHIPSFVSFFHASVSSFKWWTFDEISMLYFECAGKKMSRWLNISIDSVEMAYISNSHMMSIERMCIVVLLFSSDLMQMWKRIASNVFYRVSTIEFRSMIQCAVQWDFSLFLSLTSIHWLLPLTMPCCECADNVMNNAKPHENETEYYTPHRMHKNH